MGVFLLIVAMSVVLGKIVSVAMAEEQARRQRFFSDWEAGVAAAGLSARPVAEGQRQAHGVLNGVATHADLKREQTNEQVVFRSVIWAKSDAIPANLTLQGESALRAMSRWIDGQDETIGDPSFDDQVELPEVDAYVCAALSHQARAQLVPLLGWGGRVQGRMVVCESNWTGEHTRSLVPLVRGTAALARLLSVPPEALHRRLADNALRDPARDVRLQNLRYLAAPETRTPAPLLASTAAALLADVYAPVRLLAAEQLGIGGHAELRALAADARLELALRVQAVQGLGRPPTSDREGLLALLVESNPPELLCAALAGIGAGTGEAMSSAAASRAAVSRAAVSDAVARCARSQQPSVRAAAARTLGALAQPSTEALLCGLLSDAAAEVQQASAEALGLFGSVAAVEPLLPLAQSIVRPRLRQAARGAIGRIQSRLGNVEAGRVSLSDPVGLVGALDLADTSVGELSLAEAGAPSEGDAAPRWGRRRE